MTEAVNREHELFEDERLERVVISGHASGAEEVVRLIVGAVDAFASGCEQADDISVVVVQRIAEPRGTPHGQEAE